MRYVSLITMILLLMSLTLYSVSQEETQVGLPENAKYRIGVGRPIDVAYSPDGSMLAVASTIGIWIYDSNTYEPKTLLRGHTGSVLVVEFSSDGKTLASGSSDNTIRLWNPHTLQNIGVLTGHQTNVREVAFSYDGLLLASFGSNDKSVRLWDVKTGRSKANISGCSSDIRSLAISPDGKTIAAGEENGKVTLLSTERNKRVATLVGHTLAPSDIREPGSVLSLAFSPDGKTLASGSRDTTIRLWNVKTQKHKVTLNGHKGRVTCLTFSPDGKTVASGASYTHWSSDSAIRLWDADSCRHKSTINTHSFTYTVAFSPDNQTLASIGKDGIVHIWDIRTGELKRSLTHPKNQLRTLTVDPKVVFAPGERIIYDNKSGNIAIRNHITKSEKILLQNYHDEIRHIDISPDWNTLAIQYYKTVRLYDIDTGTHKKTISGHAGHVDSMEFSSDGKLFATASEDNIYLFDMKTGEQIATYTRDRRYQRFIHAFSPNGKLLATTTKNPRLIQLWNTETGHPQFLLMDHTSEVHSVQFSLDGMNIVSTSYNQAILWDATTGIRKATYFSPERLTYTLHFSSDGNRLVGFAKELYGDGGDIRIWIWDTETGQQIALLKQHHGHVTRTILSPDGSTFVSGSKDNTIRLWNLETGEHIRTFKGYDPYSPIVFSQDGRILASGGKNAEILLWDISTGRIKTTFTAYNPIRSIDFAEDDKSLMTSGTDGTILLWDLQ